MKKLSTDYFGWVLLLLAVIGMLTLSAWAFRMGFTYESKVLVDTWGVCMIIVASFLFVVELWEFSLLINFLMVELRGVKIFDGENLILKSGLLVTKYRIKDAVEIDFFDRMFGSRSLTQHLTYSKVKFKSGDIIYITSFTLNLTEVEKMFPFNGIKKTRRERKFFELVK